MRRGRIPRTSYPPVRGTPSPFGVPLTRFSDAVRGMPRRARPARGARSPSSLRTSPCRCQSKVFWSSRSGADRRDLSNPRTGTRVVLARSRARLGPSTVNLFSTVPVLRASGRTPCSARLRSLQQQANPVRGSVQKVTSSTEKCPHVDRIGGTESPHPARARGSPPGPSPRRVARAPRSPAPARANDRQPIHEPHAHPADVEPVQDGRPRLRNRERRAERHRDDRKHENQRRSPSCPPFRCLGQIVEPGSYETGEIGRAREGARCESGEFLLEQAHAGSSSPTMSRNRASARAVRDLTVP